MDCKATWLAMLMVAWMVQFGTSRVVDLSHPINNDTLFWPGNRPYVQHIEARGQQENFWYESNWFEMAEHGGTHLDAPAHFSEGKWRTHAIPPERLMGPGVVVDVREQAARDVDYLVGEADFRAWERDHGAIPDGAVLLANTGWWAKYPNKTQVFNSPTPNDPSTFHFPGFDPAGVQWLIDQRNVHMIGIDTPSIDHGPSQTFRSHVLAYGANIPGLENVANLGALPARGAMVYVGLIKLEDGSGGPARILAVLPDSPGRSPPLARAQVLLVWAVSALAVVGTWV